MILGNTMGEWGISFLALFCLWIFVAMFWWAVWSFYVGVIRADSDIPFLSKIDTGVRCGVINGTRCSATDCFANVTGC